MTKKTLTIQDLIDFNNSTYNVDFNIRKFQRKYRKFFKFSIISDELFIIVSRISGQTIRVFLSKDNYFECYTSSSVHLYLFKRYTISDFVNKLLKYNFV